ncbi:MAG: lysophospholipid acyltransferase family protein [Jatrophihabitans sp.]
MYAPLLPDRVNGSGPLRRRQALARGIARTLGRLETVGLTNVPADGPVVIAVNHRSALDGLLLFGLLERPVNFLVKIEAFTPPIAPVLHSAAQVSVTRAHVDAAAIRLCVEILRAGGVVGIFPEGSRGDGLVRTVKPGVGYLALRSGAAVVPVACHGTDGIRHRRSVRRPAARMVFGAAVAVDRYPDHRALNRRAVAAVTEQIRITLADLVSVTAREDPRRKAVA